MKKKFSLWLNIVTICLCVCAVAIGVYAATNASLTVGGKVAFKAHGCEGTVSGTIVGHANTADGQPATSAEPLNNGTAVAFGDANGLPLGDRYFSDMASADGSVEPIVITLTVTNTSAYAIEATLTLPTNQTGVNFDTENAIMQLGEKDSATASQTMKITMTLAEDTADFALRAITFTLNFEKYTMVKGDTTNGHYIVMGSNVVNNVVTPVKWIPFAKSTNGTTWTHVDAKTAIDTTAQYYFISEKILDVGNVTVRGTSTKYTVNAGVSYNNNYTYSYDNDSGDEEYYDTTYTTLAPNNYLASNIRQFLKSTKDSEVSKGYDYNDETCVYTPNSEKVNLLTEYGIGGYMYNKISPRTAENLYETDTNGVTYANVPSALKENANASDTLWLLSGSELDLLLGKEVGYEDYPTEADLITQTFR
ncbi:MAG: hypothetical protein IJ318_00415, partial [Clostridia bacterium]|nr:hypothetical protein [Clostridia bacterium]